MKTIENILVSNWRLSESVVVEKFWRNSWNPWRNLLKNPFYGIYGKNLEKKSKGLSIKKFLEKTMKADFHKLQHAVMRKRVSAQCFIP